MTIDKHAARATIPVDPYWVAGDRLYAATFDTTTDSWGVATSNTNLQNDGAGNLRITAVDFDAPPDVVAMVDVTDLTPGAWYRMVARVATANVGNAASRLIRIGAGNTFGPYVANKSLGSPEPWQVLTFRFQAYAPVVALKIQPNEIFNAPDARIDYVELYEDRQMWSLDLDVQDATVTLDESWSPYVQAELVCPMPDPAVYAQLDPTLAPRLRLDLTQRFGESQTVAALTATLPAGSANVADFSFRYDGINGGHLMSAVSADYGTPYNTSGMRASTIKRCDLGIRSRVVDRDTGMMTLTLASDEAEMQDARLMLAGPISPTTTTLVAAVELALSRIGAHLTDSLDVAGLDPAALEWFPGVSAWDYVAPLVEAAGRRLWCDESRRWHLSDPAQPASGGVTVLPTAKRITDSTDRDGEWYDGVVVEYRWTDTGGVDRVRYDVAGDEHALRVMHVTYDRPWAAAGAAAAILARSVSRARSVQLVAVSDYSATPGDAFTLTALDGTTDTGMVSSVSYRIPGYEMTVTTRGLTTAPEHSWLADLPDVSWQMVPAGIDWTEDV